MHSSSSSSDSLKTFLHVDLLLEVLDGLVPHANLPAVVLVVAGADAKAVPEAGALSAVRAAPRAAAVVHDVLPLGARLHDVPLRGRLLLPQGPVRPAEDAGRGVVRESLRRAREGKRKRRDGSQQRGGASEGETGKRERRSRGGSVPH